MQQTGRDSQVWSCSNIWKRLGVSPVQAHSFLFRLPHAANRLDAIVRSGITCLKSEWGTMQANENGSQWHPERSHMRFQQDIEMPLYDVTSFICRTVSICMWEPHATQL